MAIRHRAFLLDSGAFQSEVAPILEALCNGDNRPLFNTAMDVFKEVRQKDWPLSSTGESLFDISRFKRVGQPWEEPIEAVLNDTGIVHPGDIGYWLLIIFSKFVNNCTGIGINYSILDGILSERGWSEFNRKLLFEGNPTYFLIKPELTHDHPQNYDKWSYWNWMRPKNVFKEGQLSIADIKKLNFLLQEDQGFIDNYDYREFGEEWMGWTLTVPEGQLEFLTRLREAYSRATKMIAEAFDTNKSLYVTLSYQ